MGHSTITALSVWLLVSSASRSSRKQDAKECALTTEDILKTLTKEPVSGAVSVDGVKDPFVEEGKSIERDAFIDWTLTLHDKLDEALRNGAHITVVTGGQAGDLDTVASSLVMAYMKDGTLIDGVHETVALPILRFPAHELQFRPDVDYLLAQIKINPGDLIYKDNAYWDNLLERATSAILTDHNEVREEMMALDRKVVGIFDHHKDENGWRDCAEYNRLIFDDKVACRCATTLVALIGLKNTYPKSCGSSPSGHPRANCDPELLSGDDYEACVKNTAMVESKLWGSSTLCQQTNVLTPAAARLLRGAILQDSHVALAKEGGANANLLDNVARSRLASNFALPDEDSEFMTLFRSKQFESTHGQALWSIPEPEHVSTLLLMDAKFIPGESKSIILASLKVKYDLVAGQANLEEALKLALAKHKADGIEITIKEQGIENSSGFFNILDPVQSKIYYGAPRLFEHVKILADAKRGTPENTVYSIPNTAGCTSLAYKGTDLKGRPTDQYKKIMQNWQLEVTQGLPFGALVEQDLEESGGEKKEKKEKKDKKDKKGKKDS